MVVLFGEMPIMIKISWKISFHRNLFGICKNKGDCKWVSVQKYKCTQFMYKTKELCRFSHDRTRFTNTSRARFTGREDWGGYFSTVWFHSFLHRYILVCIRIDLWFDLQFPLLPQHMSPWFKRSYQSRTFSSANLLESTFDMLSVFIQLVCNARSRWVGACNSTTFPSRPLHWPVYFSIEFPWNETP